MCVPFLNPSIDMYNMFLDEALSLRFRCFVGFIVSACVYAHVSIQVSIDMQTCFRFRDLDASLGSRQIRVGRYFIQISMLKARSVLTS